ncbi:hypothetical protein QEJ31_07240 [Pigmentibacter sp. JX0631]|uniref:hypothetical protein n=1 Tax=Pigmentibacter sp. JX0631 TaxID=2976982 RepID=UPI002468F2FB|nr:hypothetical protein [Pigmentibacter sp. JX0631]WGL61384.1 hypothetical protein QEJ31_07240 [Pigmentibacter sp. JX0631]
MSSDLKLIALLLGQFTSTVAFIVVIWVFGDTETGKSLFAYIPISTIYIKSSLTVVCLLSGFYSVYRSIRLLMKKTDEVNKNE